MNDSAWRQRFTAAFGAAFSCATQFPVTGTTSIYSLHRIAPRPRPRIPVCGGFTKPLPKLGLRFFTVLTLCCATLFCALLVLMRTWECVFTLCHLLWKLHLKLWKDAQEICNRQWNAADCKSQTQSGRPEQTETLSSQISMKDHPQVYWRKLSSQRHWCLTEGRAKTQDASRCSVMKFVGD